MASVSTGTASSSPFNSSCPAPRSSLHGPEWTAIAAAKGAPVNIIANVVNGAAVWIVTTPDVSFSSVKDLKGQNVVTGLMPTTSTSLFMKLLRENGMDPNCDVKMVQVALGSDVGPLVCWV